MLTYLKWIFWIVFWAVIAAFFHYTLPQNDIVRVTDTYEKRVDFGENSLFWAQGDSGSAQGTINRDVFFIQTVRENGRPSVYRNEDTGLWGWPPYFKINTSNVQATAAEARSSDANPVWVAVRHYGWRSQVLSIFPNVLSVKRVAGPDVFIFPWTATIVLTIFGCIVWGIWSRIVRFRRNRIDPLLDDVEETMQGWRS